MNFLSAIANKNNQLFSRFELVLRAGKRNVKLQSGVDSLTDSSQLNHDILHGIANKLCVQLLGSEPSTLEKLSRLYDFDFLKKATFDFNGERLVTPFDTLFTKSLIHEDFVLTPVEFLTSDDRLIAQIINEFYFNLKFCRWSSEFQSLADLLFEEVVSNPSNQPELWKDILESAKSKHPSPYNPALSQSPVERFFFNIGTDKFVASLESDETFQELQQKLDSQTTLMSREEEIQNLMASISNYIDPDYEFYDSYNAKDFVFSFWKRYLSGETKHFSISNDLKAFFTTEQCPFLLDSGFKVFEHIIQMNTTQWVLGIKAWYQIVKGYYFPQFESVETITSNGTEYYAFHESKFRRLYQDLSIINNLIGDLENTSELYHVAFYKLFKATEESELSTDDIHREIAMNYGEEIEKFHFLNQKYLSNCLEEGDLFYSQKEKIRSIGTKWEVRDLLENLEIRMNIH
ncbi:MAG: hypothetical protein ACRCXZ_08355 [Patescibacteria group bacterium]